MDHLRPYVIFFCPLKALTPVCQNKKHSMFCIQYFYLEYEKCINDSPYIVMRGRNINLKEI